MKLVETRPPTPKCPHCKSQLMLNTIYTLGETYICLNCGAEYHYEAELKNPFTGNPIKLDLKLKKRKKK